MDNQLVELDLADWSAAVPNEAWIAALEAGKLTRTPQDEALATKCLMLKKEHGKLDFSQTAEQIHNRVRGTNPTVHI